jgi:hypothetical protein
VNWSRDKERRLHRFGLVAGLVLALIVHLYIFFGPRVSYKPVLERAKVRRVLIARPYRPKQPNADKVVKPLEKQVKPPTSIEEKPVQPAKSAESKKGGLTKKGADQSAPDPSNAVQKVTVDSSEAQVTAGKASAGQSSQDQGLEVQALTPSQSQDSAGGAKALEEATGEAVSEAEQFQQLLAQMEQQNEDIVQNKERLKTQQQRVAEEERTDELLEDSRIRIKVVSYPPAPIERKYLVIEYPELEVRESQLQSGICRVYFRVWTDAFGNIVKEQLKTPSSGPERERYKIFIDRVMEEVRLWPLPRQEGEVHVDVLFEIE